jgi:putative addiction module component (TIGR02574 family)
MSATLQSLGLDRLSAEERLALIGELWDSLDAEPPLTDAQKADLDQRLAAFHADPKAGSTWDEVKARLCVRPV